MLPQNMISERYTINWPVVVKFVCIEIYFNREWICFDLFSMMAEGFNRLTQEGVTVSVQ